MQKESEGAVLFVATILAVGLVALAGSLDFDTTTPSGFAVGSTQANAGQSCETQPCDNGLVCLDHFGQKVCKQPLQPGDHCNTADKETGCVGYYTGCYGSYCRTLTTKAKVGDTCGPVSATKWVECGEGICLGQETFWAKKAMYQRTGKCYLPHSIEGKI